MGVPLFFSNSIETNINCKPYQISHQQINNADNHALLSLNFNAYSSILINLIDNAIQADASKIDVSTEIRYESENYQYYVISVSDNGEEISAANQAKIFTPFFTTHRNSGGSGLGLSIIQSLLRNANGDICFSEDNGLKTFTIRIPILNKKIEQFIKKILLRNLRNKTQVNNTGSLHHGHHFNHFFIGD